MTKYRALLLLPLLLLLAVPVQSFEVQAPELFGDGTMYVMGGQRFAGFVSAWGGWLIYGTRHDCRIVQLYGTPIGGAEKPVPCHMVFKKQNRFTGWIDFRGHTRKFCGATDRTNIPPKCYGE